MPKSSTNIGWCSEHATSEQLESSNGRTHLVPTTSLPTETSAPTVAVLVCGGPEKREAEAMIIDQWPSFNSEVSHSRQYPRATMQWIGEDEDAKSTDDLIFLNIYIRKTNSKLRES